MVVSRTDDADGNAYNNIRLAGIYSDGKVIIWDRFFGEGSLYMNLDIIMVLDTICQIYIWLCIPLCTVHVY